MIKLNKTYSKSIKYLKYTNILINTLFQRNLYFLELLTKTYCKIIIQFFYLQLYTVCSFENFIQAMTILHKRCLWHLERLARRVWWKKSFIQETMKLSTCAHHSTNILNKMAKKILNTSHVVCSLSHVNYYLGDLGKNCFD